MNTPRKQEIFWIIWKNEPVGISGIAERMTGKVSVPTLNRDLSSLKKDNHIISEGSGPGIKYRVNLKSLMTTSLNMESYFKTETDDRKIIDRYSPEIFKKLSEVELFSEPEIKILKSHTALFREKIKDISDETYKREFERLMIELSWKSSQIEGNTYDLLDTEQLLKYNIPSPKHSEEETRMLLNHKSAIEYIRENLKLFSTLSVGKIVDIHSLLIKGLNISKSMRNKIGRITGTKYLPPDNQFVIEEGVLDLCRIVNSTNDEYTKALLALTLISYIQPFDDGNKRTARLVANGILMANNMCPLSYRSVKPGDYKKATLLFYELNNVSAIKEIFISQYQFGVENYF